MPKYKAIIFDYGGVIHTIPDAQGIGIFNVICNHLHLDAEEFKTLYFANNHNNNLGNWTHKKTLLYVVGKLAPEKKELAEQVIDNFLNDCTTNHELLSYIRKLKERGYVVALLSNYNSSLRDHIAENGVAEIFGGNVFISTEIGYQKPNPKIFEHTFNRLAVSPEEVIFIDDSPMSLSTAESVGYHPIRFTGNEKLVEDLCGLGINLED